MKWADLCDERLGFVVVVVLGRWSGREAEIMRSVREMQELSVLLMLSEMTHCWGGIPEDYRR